MARRPGHRARRYTTSREESSQRSANGTNDIEPRQDAIDRFERMLDIQVSTLDGIDSKAAKLISFVGVLLGVIATAARVVPGMQGSSTQAIDNGTIAGAITLVIGVLGLLISLSYATIAYLSSEFEYGLEADIASQFARTLDVNEQAYRTVVLRAYGDSIRENKPIIDANARRFRYALASLVGALFALMFSAGYYLVHLPDPVELVTLFFGAIVVGALCLHIRDEAYLTTAKETESGE